MKTVSQLGIYMDHSNAILMELKEDEISFSNVSSGFTHEDKEFTLSRNERLMHNKEQQKQLTYYKKLSDTILNFQEVILFGPTEAKKELYNLLKSYHLFDKIKIEIRGSDKMDESQMKTFIREYFQ